MKIVLLGYMGSGKTTVGKILANGLGLSFLDLDACIEEAVDSSIADIFNTKGEVFFRKKEHEILNGILQENNNYVLATGGGTPCYSGNMETMLAHTTNIFYVKVPLPELVKRLRKEKEHRPLIKSILEEDLPGFIGKHLFERSFFYEKAPHTIVSHVETAERIAEEIKNKLD